jgi:glycosyltransferase involved in cell wall biosynthesis
MRVALVHDWLTGMRGGERVLEQMIALAPAAELFTLVHVKGSVSSTIERLNIHTSWLNHLPGIAKTYRLALPVMPSAIERFDLRGFDLIVSSSHCVAKGVRVPEGVPHICYCHTPMRYLYDQSEVYVRRSGPFARAGLQLMRERLQRWDRATAARVTHFIANSNHVRERIARIYGRDAAVIHPPVDIGRFHAHAQRDDYYVTLSALVPYKRVDLIVRAFNKLGRRLLVIGSGPERARLHRQANRNIEFTGWIPDAQVAELLARARGFVFAGVEDFGIALVEAQAAGAPVIAYARGGALETVVDGVTGVLFQEQTEAGLVEAVNRAERCSFAPSTLRAQAERFGIQRFRTRLESLLYGRSREGPPDSSPAVVDGKRKGLADRAATTAGMVK